MCFIDIRFIDIVSIILSMFYRNQIYWHCFHARLMTILSWKEQTTGTYLDKEGSRRKLPILWSYFHLYPLLSSSPKISVILIFAIIILGLDFACINFLLYYRSKKMGLLVDSHVIEEAQQCSERWHILFHSILPTQPYIQVNDDKILRSQKVLRSFIQIIRPL